MTLQSPRTCCAKVTCGGLIAAIFVAAAPLAPAMAQAPPPAPVIVQPAPVIVQPSVVQPPPVVVQPPAVVPSPAPTVVVPTAPYPMISSPQDVATCLCLERSVSTLSNEVLARNRIYEEKKGELGRLETELANQRSRMNVNDPAQVDAFRGLLDRRNAIQAEFAAQVTPEYSALVDNYNRQVGEFNARCSGRAYDGAVVASVRPTLSCPAQ